MPGKPVRSEEVILKHLVRHQPRQISLRWLLIGCAIAPIAIWLLYSTYVTTTVWQRTSEHITDQERRNINNLPSEPTIAKYAISAAATSVACGVFAMIGVMGMGQRLARHIAFLGATVAAIVLSLAIFLAVLNGNGFRDVRIPDNADIFVTFAIPISIAIAIGLASGWAVAETS